MPTCQLCLVFLISLTSSLAALPLTLDVQAEAAILMNGLTGQILYAKNIHAQHYPASLTKIATAWLTLERAHEQLEEMLTVDQASVAWVGVEAKKRSNYTLAAHLLEPGSSHIGLKKGEQLSLRTLLYGLMLASGDDAANVIAKYVGGGSIASFMTDLNARLGQLGCQNTHLTNPHGLFHPEHYTTAYDMALLTQAALQNATFRTVVSTKSYARPRTEQQAASIFSQTNKLLRAGPYYYPYAIGVKTGWINAAQHTLVAAAEKEGRLLIAVLLKSKDRGDNFRDAIQLFETAFTQPIMQTTLLTAGPQPFSQTLPGADAPITTYTDDEITIAYYPAEEPRLSCQLIWEATALPILAGQRLGLFTVTSSDGKIVREVPLKARHHVEETWWYALQRFIKNSWSWRQLLAAAALAFFIALGLAAKSRR